MQERFLLGTLVMCFLIGLIFELYPDRPRDKWESLTAFALALLLAALGWGAYWAFGWLLL